MFQKILAGPLMLLYVGVGLWGFFLVSQYVYYEFGWIGVVLGVIVFPAAYGLAPLYAGIVDGYWTPLFVCYAPFFLMFVLSVLGGLFTMVADKFRGE